MSARIFLVLVGLIFFAAVPLCAQFSTVVTISGLSTAGTSFDLEIADASITRAIPFGPLGSDYKAPGMASLMVSGINDDFRRNGKTGFQAKILERAVEGAELGSSFTVLSATPITSIKIGPSGGAMGAPRAPGISYNPQFIHQDGNLPGPFAGTQFGSVNANLLINGIDPDENRFRKVEVPVDPLFGGSLDFEVFGLPGMGIAAFGGQIGDGFTTTVGGVFQFPPNGPIVDVGVASSVAPFAPLGLTVFASGLTSIPINFDPSFMTDASGRWALSLPLVPGTNTDPLVGFQVAIADPTVLPIPFNLTQAGRPVIRSGRTRLIIPSQVDGSRLINFLPGMTFDFYGMTGLSQVRAFENGFLTFGAQAPVAGGMGVDAVAQLQQGAPSIFVNWADWAFAQQAGMPTDGFVVEEFGDVIRFKWGQGTMPFTHAGDTDMARFECALVLNDTNPQFFNPDTAGMIRFDYRLLDGAAADGNDSVVGISAGMGLGAPFANFDLGLNRFAPNALGALVQQSNRSASAQSVVPTFAGAQPFYSNGSGWSERSLTIFPPTGSGPLMNRYYAIANEPRPDDLAAVDPSTNTLSLSGGTAQAVNLIGFFLYVFDRMGVPTANIGVVPSGLPVSPTPLNIVAVSEAALDTRLADIGAAHIVPPPGFRSYEFLQATLQAPLPAVAPGSTLDVVMTFASGESFILPAAITVMP